MNKFIHAECFFDRLCTVTNMMYCEISSPFLCYEHTETKVTCERKSNENDRDRDNESKGAFEQNLILNETVQVSKYT